MRELCPRCETSFIKNSTTCQTCGYRMMVSCATCGHQNVPRAVFCGGCGMGMRFSTRMRQRWVNMVSQPTRVRLKNMGAGFLFGGILAFFAFGSMGMSKPDLSKVQPIWAPAEVESPFTNPAARNACSSISVWKSAQQTDRGATLADLVRVGNLLLQKCPPIGLGTADQSSPEGSDSERFLQNLGSLVDEKETTPVRRADAALFFYRLAGELFSLTGPETSVYQFADIPRYHYLNIPVDSLEAIGIRIAREPELFGGEDPISIADLSQVSIDFVKAYENRVKMKAFSSLDPAS